MSIVDRFEQRLSGTDAVVRWLHANCEAIAAVSETIFERLQHDGAVYTCGNGGSAAEAMHLAEELIGRYAGSDRPPLPAVCLNADATALTCIANDFGYDAVFARQCAALLTERDVLVVLSTSGNSPNVVNAAEAARQRGATVIGLLGKGGGACAEACDHVLVVDSDDSAHVQEAHLVIVHLICEAIEMLCAARARG